MKFLALGARGMAGHIICFYLREAGEKVIGFAREPLDDVNVHIGDAHDIKQIEEIIHDEKPDVVVNCVGILNTAVDKNLTEGIYINSYFPHLLAKICYNNGAFLIHISTDCVFSGNAKQYNEQSIPDATSYYGRTKYLGELNDSHNLTIRTSIIGPELKTNGIGLFHWFMNEGQSVTGYRKVLWSGVTTVELVKAIYGIAKQRITGLCHLSNNIPIPKYDLLQLLNKRFRGKAVKITPSDTPVSSKVIISTRNDFTYAVPSYSDMVDDMAVWMNTHKHLYSHYEKTYGFT